MESKTTLESIKNAKHTMEMVIKQDITRVQDNYYRNYAIPIKKIVIDCTNKTDWKVKVNFDLTEVE